MKQSIKEKIISQILRVDHAGEYGAFYIYAGQQWSFRKNPEMYAMLQEMKEHESVHLQYFSNQLPVYKSRPSFLLPLWKLTGFSLGALTGLLGKKGAMACTVAVEEVIEKHYKQQLELLETLDIKDPELSFHIHQFREEELEHKHIGLENEAEELIGYQGISKIIKLGCKLAIFLSKRI